MSLPRFPTRPLLTLAFTSTLLSFGAQAAPLKQTALAASASSAAAAPRTLYSAELLAQMLLSEIALSRGMLDEAAYGYTDLARRSQDVRLVRRANEIEFARLLQQIQANPGGAETLLRQQLASATPEARQRLLLQLPAIFARHPDKQAAAQITQRLAAPYQDVAEAQYGIAMALRNANDVEAAWAAAQRAHAARPDWEPGILLLAELAPQDRQAEAGAALKTFSTRNPKAIDARAAYARWLVMNEHKDEATREARALVEANPENDALRFAMVGVLVEGSDFANAEASLQRLLHDGWGEPDRLRLILAQVQEEQGKNATALMSYASVQPGEYFVSAQGRHARLLAATGQLAAARSVLHQAALESPEDRVALRMQEALLLRQAEQRQEALGVYDSILAEQPDNTDALYDSALLAEQLGRPAELERRLRKLLAINPEHAHALNALAYSMIERRQRLPEARRMLEQALKLEPEDPAILDSMGWLDFRQGRLVEAEAMLRKAYAQFPDPEIASHLVEALWANGKRDEARALLRKALASDPDAAPLQQTAKRLGL